MVKFVDKKKIKHVKVANPFLLKLKEPEWKKNQNPSR